MRLKEETTIFAARLDEGGSFGLITYNVTLLTFFGPVVQWIE